MKKELAVPVSIAQVDIANRLHEQLPQWQITDRTRTLNTLHVRFPDFGIEATLLKVTSINQLYGTNEVVLPAKTMKPMIL